MEQIFADPSKHFDLYQQYLYNLSSRANEILECPYCSCKGEHELIAIMHIPKCFEMYLYLTNTFVNASRVNMNFQASNPMMTSVVPTAPVPALPGIPPRPTRNPPSKRPNIPAQNTTALPPIELPRQQMPALPASQRTNDPDPNPEPDPNDSETHVPMPVEYSGAIEWANKVESTNFGSHQSQDYFPLYFASKMPQ
jgi:hypothetical protein